MKFSDQELRKAVRKAGQNGESFASADVRRCLGLTTKDRGELTRFQNRFRAFQKTAESELEKIGRNLYRLKEQPAKRKRASAAPTESPLEAPAEQLDRPPAAAIGSARQPVAMQDLVAEAIVAELDAVPAAEYASASMEPEDTAETLEAPPVHPQPPGETRPSDFAALHDARLISSPADEEQDSGTDTIEITDDMLLDEDAAADEVSPPADEHSRSGGWVPRSWLERGQWLGQRVAGLFSRS